MSNHTVCALALVAGETYMLKVLDVIDRNKSFPKKGRTAHVYYVDLENKDGKTCRAEYVTYDKSTMPFVIGLFQLIRCGIVGNVGMPEIEPVVDDAVSQHKEHRQQTEGKANLQSAAHRGMIDEPNQYGLKVSGSALIFAMAYAKDLKVAGIRARGTDCTANDIADVIEWSETINEAIASRMAF